MSRRTTAKKRVVLPDAIYRSRLVTMMTNRLLMEGKKSLARRLFYESLEQVERLTDSSPATLEKGKASSSSAKVAAAAPSQSETASHESGTALKIFQQAVLNVTPVVEVKSRRVGGSNYQVPLEVNSERGTALALRWLVQAARQRPGREMAIKLANEFIDASNKTGNAIRKREETHRMAEANKAFANYRF